MELSISFTSFESRLGQNVTLSYTEFFLLPFPGITNFRQILVAPCISVYIIILVLNFLISYIVLWKKSLHTPMYILISLLLCLNILGTTVVTPEMIQSLLAQTRISLSGCLSQMFFVYSSTMFKSIVLLLMAFDRYVAVCKALRYHEIITRNSLLQLSFVGLCRNSVLVSVLLFLSARVQYCKSNIIMNFVCEYGVLLNLACGDVSRVQMVGLVVRIGVNVLDVTVLLVCYMKVLSATLKIAVGSARRKALNTCGNHLLVAHLVYSCGLLSSILYKVEQSMSYDFQNLSRAIYFFFPAIANPVIYGLRVSEIKDCLIKPWKKKLLMNRKKHLAT
ncbi:olfactory receptor 52K2-like [Hyperolius riggenbachi]|uniref:olfactory receptor 52K2-like n=1 Tax=Hyperolius riggenbachi TaxID=752182 RepID=UPI0035A3404F